VRRDGERLLASPSLWIRNITVWWHLLLWGSLKARRIFSSRAPFHAS